MNVVYYRKPDGKIRYFHEVQKVPEGELRDKVDYYNRTCTEDRAYIATYEDGSFEAFLFRKATERITLDIAELREALDALDNVDTLIRELISQAEQAGRSEK